MNICVNTIKPYEITIGNNLFENFSTILRPHIKENAILVFDANIPRVAIEKIVASFEKEKILHQYIVLEKHGESVKTLEFFGLFCEKLLTQYNITRLTTLIAIGGGTIGDFIGFVASSLMRGIPFIQVPTTLLSMVDSSVGGKVAINIGKYKNTVGAFYQPQHVLIDIAFLQTLSSVELSSGYAEVLKYGLIYNREFYQYLLENTDIFSEFIRTKQLNEVTQNYLMNILYKSCKAKVDIVVQDELETKQIREILNFGHTFGHALEGVYLGKIPHGFAVGIGMIYAMNYCNINTQTVERHYEKVGLYSTIQEFCNTHNIATPTPLDLIIFMVKDKKNTKNQTLIEIEGTTVIDTIKLILITDIGKPFVQNIPTIAIYKFLKTVL